jgi:integrase
MSHNTDTQSCPTPMPRHSGLLKRNGRYYHNVRVPTDLLAAYGKTKIIRRSLDTSDWREAVRRVHTEAFKLDAEFAEKRRKLAPRVVSDLTDREAHEFAARWLISLEKISTEWWNKEGSKFDAQDREMTLENFRIDEMVYCGGNKHYQGADASSELDNFLKAEGLICEKGSPAYQKLRELFRLARLENIQRDIDRVSLNGVRRHQIIFQEVSASTRAAKSTNLSELVAKHKQSRIDIRSTPGTLKTYEVPGRLLCEVLGKNTRLDEISKDDAEKLLALLRRTPSNATKIYRGMTLQQAIEVADREQNENRLSPKTLENYFNNISAIFNFAVEKKLIAENPFKDRVLRKIFSSDDEDNVKALFTIDELNRLFKTPLYTGCANDESGYKTAGENRPRRGRFWVPLLSLFHGLRLNEAAQLFTEDICDEDGTPYIYVRATRADGSKCEKHLKTKQSKRRVPVHPELLRMGFLDFVATRRVDVEHPRLFPELPYSPTGYFSNPFSKWFGRFKESALGDGCAATFHSFRHQFRTALGNARVPLADVEMLGGWEIGKRSSEKQYDQPTMARLFSCVQAVNFPGLDLSHLYVRSLRSGTRRALEF